MKTNNQNQRKMENIKFEFLIDFNSHDLFVMNYVM